MDPNEYQIEGMPFDRVCVVCEKPVRIEESVIHLKADNEMISICCPLCYETYQKKPSYYLALRALRKTQASPFDR
jgi:hypothetical protein